MAKKEDLNLDTRVKFKIMREEFGGVVVFLTTGPGVYVKAMDGSIRLIPISELEVIT